MALTVCFLPSSESLGAFNHSRTFTTLDLVASLLDSQLRLDHTPIISSHVEMHYLHSQASHVFIFRLHSQ